jgi:hypothetical protein
MDDNKELLGYLTEKKLEGIKKRYNFSIITNVILIIVIAIIGAYVVANIEEFKELNQDVCRLCETKTGGTCMAQTYGDIVKMIKEEGNKTTPAISMYNLTGLLIKP